MTTEYLHVDARTRRSRRTDKAVTIEEPRGIIHSVGLELDNKAKTLKLNPACRGTLQPQALPTRARSELEVTRPTRSCARARALALALRRAHAEKADREKPITFTSDDGEVNYEKRTGVLKGNVVITQGTLTIKAEPDRLQAERRTIRCPPRRSAIRSRSARSATTPRATTKAGRSAPSTTAARSSSSSSTTRS